MVCTDNGITTIEIYGENCSSSQSLLSFMCNKSKDQETNNYCQLRWFGAEYGYIGDNCCYLIW